MKIRDEEEGDGVAIRELTQRAFAGHTHGSGGEADLIDALRRTGALTLSLVAEDRGCVVGHVAFSPVRIGDGAIDGWHGLGPLSVTPARQRQGIGSALVGEGLRRLQDRGGRGCVLVGEPAFYARFGFEACPRLTFEGVPAEYFLCRWIDGPLPAGEVHYDAAFASV